MKNLWFTFIPGRVLVKVEGKGIERLLNSLHVRDLVCGR